MSSPISSVNESSADHTALDAGAGRIGLYRDVSFTIPGISQFTPDATATPAIGTPGQPEQVEEVKIEMESKGEEVTRGVVRAIRDSHPYEEVVVDVFRLESF